MRQETGEKLRRAITLPGFGARPGGVLDREVVDVEAYPELKRLCWNRGAHCMGARDAPAHTRASGGSQASAVSNRRSAR